MREIKFRAWDGVKMSQNSKSIAEIAEDGIITRDPNKLTFLQFTGIKDKNGKEIYENDLVRFEDEGIVFTIQYCGSSFVMHHGSDEAAIEYVLDRFNNDVEVIGNIYENPEQLV